MDFMIILDQQYVWLCTWLQGNLLTHLDTCLIDLLLSFSAFICRETQPNINDYLNLLSLNDKYALFFIFSGHLRFQCLLHLGYLMAFLSLILIFRLRFCLVRGWLLVVISGLSLDNIKLIMSRVHSHLFFFSHRINLCQSNCFSL